MIPRLFFFASVCAALLITISAASDSLQTRPVTGAVRTGQAVWRAHRCEGCHTLHGQGGAYAPDLTHIYSQRGSEYLREFMVNPGAFHPGQRIMPRFGLTAREMGDLLAFLEWVEEQSSGWPPRALQVSSGMPALSVSSAEVSSRADGLPENQAERGRYWFQRPPAVCATCHSLEPEVVIVGPSLAGIGTRAAQRLPGVGAEDYIRSSILDPGAYVVEGFQNVMARNLGAVLTADQINDIIVFLLMLE